MAVNLIRLSMRPQQSTMYHTSTDTPEQSNMQAACSGCKKSGNLHTVALQAAATATVRPKQRRPRSEWVMDKEAWVSMHAGACRIKVQVIIIVVTSWVGMG
jgi:hypothetical protein